MPFGSAMALARTPPVVGGGGSPGTMPAFGAVGAVVDSATLAATHVPSYPAGVTSGQYLLVIAAWRHNDGDGAFSMHADMGADGWTEVSGSPKKQGSGNVGCHLFEKIATGAHSGPIPGGVVGVGGANSDQVAVICTRWTAADGFAATPVEAMSSTTTNSATTTHNMAPVTTTDDNRLAVQITILNNDLLAMASATGESGGDWGEVVDVQGTAGGDITIHIQTAAMASAGTITGGTTTSAASCTSITFGLALAPADV